ncbi:MAG: Zn-ribbon domain-containing OB-fold protein [Candidatus Methylomirabilia bacterium]
MITLKTFFEEARAGQLTGIRCQGCGRLAIPPEERCEGCSGRTWESVPLAGHGTIASFTVFGDSPKSHPAEAPYAAAVVKLDEGVSLVGRIVDIPLESLQIGLPVRFCPITTEHQTVVGFGPA